MKRNTIVTAMACLATLASTGSLRSEDAIQPQEQALAPGRPMLIGVDYYPEHWPRERWEIDRFGVAVLEL